MKPSDGSTDPCRIDEGALNVKDQVSGRFLRLCQPRLEPSCFSVARENPDKWHISAVFNGRAGYCGPIELLVDVYMKFLIGLLGVIASVLGGFVGSGGNLIMLWHPFELIIILGGAGFALVIGSSIETIKGIGRDLKFVISGLKYKEENYLDLFSFLFLLLDKGRRSGMLALEDDVDRPEESEIWQQFPPILSNHHVKDFVCDIIRIKINGNLNVHEVEALMDICLLYTSPSPRD